MAFASLQQKMDRAGDFLETLRNYPAGAYAFPVVPPEFSNWRDEQYAWAHGVALLDLSHHMTYEFMRGPDILKLVSLVGANSFKGFCVGKAKQLICASPEGYLIGDGILFFLAEEEMLYVGRPILANWLRYHGETARLDVSFQREDKSPSQIKDRLPGRSLYRFQIQGPQAEKLIAKLNGGAFPDIKFFNMGRVRIGDRQVHALRHGMAGAPGLEIWGPYSEGEAVREAILSAGEEFGLVQVGARAYPTTAVASAWIPSTLPAIYTGESMRPYREWLNGDSYEGRLSIGGSYVPGSFEPYYLTPFELGYGQFIKFDHDFIGDRALRQMPPESQRKKVTFEWSAQDVATIFASFFDDAAENYKYIELPVPRYSFHDYDAVSVNGEPVGVSMISAYDFNYRALLSLGVVAPTVDIGQEVVITWGEPGGGTRKSTVERHRQFELRARVAPAPYSKMARETYRKDGVQVA